MLEFRKFIFYTAAFVFLVAVGVAGNSEAGPFVGLKLKVDAAVNADSANAAKIDEGVMTLPLAAAGDPFRLQMAIRAV